MHKVQRAVQQSDMGHIGRVIQRHLHLAEDIIVPLLDGVGNGVTQRPGGDLLLDVGAGSIGGDGGNAHARSDLRSWPVVPAEEGTYSVVQQTRCFLACRVAIDRLVGGIFAYVLVSRDGVCILASEGLRLLCALREFTPEIDGERGSYARRSVLFLSLR